MTQPYDYLEKIADTWRENDRLDVVLLRAICRLSVELPEKAEEGFTSLEIVEAISKLRGKPWSSRDDKNQMSSDIRRQWNKLLETWETKHEGVVQRFTDEGQKVLPHLTKTEGGGAGRLSKYRIEWRPHEDSLIQSIQETGEAQIQDLNSSLRYICEDIEDAGLLARAFTKGYRLTGWRKQLFLLGLALPLLFGFLFFVYFIFGFAMFSTVGTKSVITSLLSLIFVYWATWYTIGSLLTVATNKIVLAPWWMQSDNGDRLLEHRYPPRYPEKSIKAVRYTAKCPACDGTISAQSGGLEFKGRIIGRCEHAPKEHIYSFDHVTRKGKSLR